MSRTYLVCASVGCFFISVGETRGGLPGVPSLQCDQASQLAGGSLPLASRRGSGVAGRHGERSPGGQILVVVTALHDAVALTLAGDNT